MRALSRKNAYRKSLLRNLSTSLVLYERITTTTAKAKETKSVVERLINRSKTGDLAARRRLLAYLFDEKATKKVLEVLVPRYKNKKSGFVRIYKLSTRLGDGAEESILELDKAPKEVVVEEKSDDNVKEKNGKKPITAKKDK
jgi:large subunit ribosomal protein L17